MKDTHDTPLLCHRCGCDLAPGEGNFYVVRIEAFADPAPPNIDTGDPFWNGNDPGEQIDALIDQMKHMTERDLMDQVHRRLTIHLCGRCYQDWIENPAG